MLHCAEINANKSKGRDIPTPKNTKLNKFVTKSRVDVLIANRTMSDAGLHGRTIAPKKKPKINELRKGFLVIGAFIWGKSREKSKSKIKNKLTTAKIPKAIGEIIPIALVNEAWRNFVKINPNKNIENITPEATINPKRIIVFFDSFSDTWFDKYARNAGYNGKTQTAASGANKPARKDIQKLTNTLTITFLYFFF